MKPKKPKDKPGQTQVQWYAFTLLELLLVIVVIVFVGAAITPAFTRTASQSAAPQCRSNLRQLGNAWLMYAHDNNERLVSNHDGTLAGLAPGVESWVSGWLDLAGSGYPPGADTNTAYLVDHQNYIFGAYFGPYIRAPQLFHCPADRSMDFSLRLPRVRSYSMNNLLNGRDFDGTQLLCKNLQEIAAPDRVLTILDEREECLNDGTFFLAPGIPGDIVDFPAVRHAGAAGIVFADAHVETHKWVDPRTMPVLHPGQELPVHSFIAADPDVNWIQEHGNPR